MRPNYIRLPGVRMDLGITTLKSISHSSTPQNWNFNAGKKERKKDRDRDRER